MESFVNNTVTPIILVTNDDGIESPGLIAAVQAVVGLGRVVVVAPTSQQTSRGRSMIGDWTDFLHPTELPGMEAEVYHLEASPALAVQHAMNTIFATRWPDLVVSGVNYGENLGMDITISGTVGAAFQAASYGIPSIAASQQSDIAHHYEYGDLDWTGAVRVVRKYAAMMVNRLAEEVLRDREAHVGTDRLALPRPFPFDVLKIDVPRECPPETPERICRLSRRHYFRHTIADPTPESPLGGGRTWVDDDPTLIAEDTDIHVLAFERSVALTPLSLDFTAPLEESAAHLGF
jgi:5'-nucleotidase